MSRSPGVSWAAPPRSAKVHSMIGTQHMAHSTRQQQNRPMARVSESKHMPTFKWRIMCHGALLRPASYFPTHRRHTVSQGTARRGGGRPQRWANTRTRTPPIPGSPLLPTYYRTPVPSFSPVAWQSAL